MLDWIPALMTTTIFAALVWLSKSLIITRLTNSVKNEFDSKIEKLKSDLNAKEVQIESLINGAMSGLMTRQSSLYQRQLQAIDELWHSVKELEKAKYISAALVLLKLEECTKESVNNPKFREFIEIIGGNFKIESIDLSGAKKARPFLTPLAWAYYSAYSNVIMLAVTKIKLLKISVENLKQYFDFESTKKLLKKVLPLQSDYIDKYDSSTYHYFLDQIEELLLLELQNIQKGLETDKDNAVRAAEIIKKAGSIANEITKIKAIDCYILLNSRWRLLKPGFGTALRQPQPEALYIKKQ